VLYKLFAASILGITTSGERDISISLRAFGAAQLRNLSRGESDE